jgi:hypothetical protein
MVAASTSGSAAHQKTLSSRITTSSEPKLFATSNPAHESAAAAVAMRTSGRRVPWWSAIQAQALGANTRASGISASNVPISTPLKPSFLRYRLKYGAMPPSIRK